MYESFYGFKEKPFNLTPDPGFLYMSHGHENAYTHLEYAIAENKGFVVITGEIGSGKTTLINFLLQNINKDLLVGIVNHTSIPPLEFIKMICREFELEVGQMDKAGLLEALQQFLLRQFARKKRVVLIIDEAQNLPPKTMEEIRMLSNIEAEKHHLIQIILAGQPELKSKLQRRDLEQLAQRVTAYCHIGGLNEDEVNQYIRHRFQVAGAENLEVFDQGAVKAVYRHSRGIPRMINVLCDTALVYGYADDMKIIGRRVIEDVVKARKIGTERADVNDARSEKAILSPSPNTSSEAPPFPENWKRRLQSLENRVRLLEDLISNMDRVVKLWTENMGRRDRIVIELFKMLKESMESRMKIVQKNIRPEEHSTMNESKSSRLSLFKRKQ
jgi:general secretion pathway protein A